MIKEIYEELIQPLLHILTLCALFGGAIFGIGYVITSLDCAAYERATGKPTKIVFFTCYVQDKGRWFAWEEYKYRLIAKGEQL